ncbi:LnmK family bifunctional acyltransferase/decarboxylase [Kitasatospora sp. SolWspMP-SS2h]|uniref:LnmK family bifunctional acyltransferase/decarboxylase n=1 Tax=Kitasatospora sp. SolWspMP-SS2h TaxID=1305729 RepID=UPI000DB9138E|nr:LnmK family bifunctional acyltransferase/decarboxylase [Kitasatospora sp. SolWspMP-SS2h]
MTAVPDMPVFSSVHRTGAASLRRTETVRPGMCGPLQSFVACVGDWTWEAVSAVCGLDVFSARNPQGEPCYLAFYSYRITANGLHPGDLTFGDKIVVDTLVRDSGRLSVLTAHRLRREDAGEHPPFDLAELYGAPRPGCLYVENLNVWLTRGEGTGNVGLIRSAPTGFEHRSLPSLPERYSPRVLCAQAREQGRFPHPGGGPWSAPAPQQVFEQPVDAVRDVNGAGLLYFASFFSLAEAAVLRQWRSRGLDLHAHRGRLLADARICYLGNADVDAQLTVTAATSFAPADSHRERCDVSVCDQGTGRTIALAAFDHHIPLPPPRAAP